MAKRKTIGENPLDAVMPDPAAGRREEKSAAKRPRPPIPVSPTEAQRPAGPAPTAVKQEKGIAAPAQVAPSHTPSQNDLLSRIQFLEGQNVWIQWLAYGAIGLALLL